MVKAMIDIDEHANRVLNIVKAKFGLHDKSQAINVMAIQYEEEVLEPEMRPEFIAELKKSQKEKAVPIKNLAKHLGLEE